MNLWDRWKKRTSDHLNEEIIPYTTEPASAFLFAPTARYADLASAKMPQYLLSARPHSGLNRLTKMERLSGYLPGMSTINANVINASVEVIGVRGSESVIEVQSQVDSASQAQAQALLTQVTIEQKNSHLRLFSPPGRRAGHCLTQIAITCPSQRHVTIQGVYSAVRLTGLTEGVDVETTHGRITLLNLAASVNAKVKEGIIDYSGHQGLVRLFAGWELNLNFTLPTFDGRMEAVAEGPVRVLLSAGFRGSLEANVAKGAVFVCRAALKTPMIRREEDGRVIHSFGEGIPNVRLMSIKGPLCLIMHRRGWKHDSSRVWLG